VTALATCLKEARSYWDGGKPNTPESVQSVRARVCVELLATDVKRAEDITVLHAAKLLRRLADRGLARKTIGDYYSTFKRMLQLNDITPKGFARWPKPPVAPRKSRTPISAGDFARMGTWLNERDYGATADLATLLNAIGGRVQREVLQKGNMRYRTLDGVLLVFITGKGGHEREVPVVCQDARAIITDRMRYQAVLAIPYKTHLKRWNAGRHALGIKGLATFHAIRHKYATEALVRSKNLRLVQELLGHSNPATTAIYAHVSLDDKVKALTEVSR
jgi:site-specific recombinase XerC